MYGGNQRLSNTHKSVKSIGQINRPRDHTACTPIVDNAQGAVRHAPAEFLIAGALLLVDHFYRPGNIPRLHPADISAACEAGRVPVQIMLTRRDGTLDKSFDVLPCDCKDLDVHMFGHRQIEYDSCRRVERIGKVRIQFEPARLPHCVLRSD